MSTSLKWCKSSYSGSRGGSEGGACVEVATCPHTIHVRDSKNPHGPALIFPADAWASFVAAVKGTATA